MSPACFRAGLGSRTQASAGKAPQRCWHLLARRNAKTSGLFTPCVLCVSLLSVSLALKIVASSEGYLTDAWRVMQDYVPFYGRRCLTEPVVPNRRIGFVRLGPTSSLRPRRSYSKPQRFHGARALVRLRIGAVRGGQARLGMGFTGEPHCD